jgi:hypothetical protein
MDPIDIELNKILEECCKSQEECQHTIDQLLSGDVLSLELQLSRYYPDDISEARTFEEYLEMKSLLPVYHMPSIPIYRQESSDIDIKMILYIVLSILFGCVYLQL